MADVAAAGFKTVGTYMLAQVKSDISEPGVYGVITGETTSGSNLTPEANGTWRNMGINAYSPSIIPGTGNQLSEATPALFLRIS
jgi:hypothetical protein